MSIYNNINQYRLYVIYLIFCITQYCKYLIICTMWLTILFLNISQYKYKYLSVLFNVLHSFVLQLMAGLQGSCNGFAYTIDSKEGVYVLNITNAAAILIRDEMTGDFAADVLRCASIVPNLPY